MNFVNKKIMLAFIILTIFFKSQVNGQAQIVTNKVVQPSKIVLANQVMHFYQMDTAIELAIKNSDFQFKKSNDLIEKSNNKKAKQIYQEYLKTIENSNIENKENITTEVQLQLTNQFTEQELKYLIEIAKYEVFNKFKSYLESDKYNKTIYSSFSKKKSYMMSL